MEEKKIIMTSNFGAPVGNDQDSLTAGKPGPILLQDTHLLEKLAHFDRERIPERVIHAKGAGAYGYFEVTNDLTKYTSAKLFSRIGKKTDLFVRFSTMGGERGSTDAERDLRGFAVKFYSEEGNYDLVGSNTPVFFIRDPLKFPDFIHTQKRDPASNLKDANMFWDFLSLVPESIHQVTILFSDRGTPKSYRHINGYGSHTFMWYNDKKEYFWVKYHFKTSQGIQNFTADEAEKMKARDPDHATRDLFQAIKKENYPSWDLDVQIMHPDMVDKYRFDPFDATKVWPHQDFPLIPLGRMVLNHNPTDYFSEVEQAAFSPANFVPGIGPSPDKMLQGRLFSYHDTQYHRLGANYHLIPVNCPKEIKINNYQQEGYMSSVRTEISPNYHPNSFSGPQPLFKTSEPELEFAGKVSRYATLQDDYDFIQAGNLYRAVMKNSDRDNLINNIVPHLKNALKRIQLRQTVLFYKADPEYGSRIGSKLELNVNLIKTLAFSSNEELIKATKEDF